MAELKTKETKENPKKFLDGITPEQKQKDSFELLNIFTKVTGEKPVMWGTSMIGFGKYHYKSERSSQEGDWPLVGFSPRKQNLTLYVITGTEEKEQLEKLGKHTTSVGCLYIKKLDDVDRKVLMSLIKKAYVHKKKAYK
jgi:hypothetical protein